jgi:glycine/D-amino acid oxidase-like deaminating enzyme
MRSVVPAPGLPWWLEEAPPEPPEPPVRGAITADVAVVGAGYTGLWTALTLREREPGLRVVVVERDVCGRGPSGRNGGFLHGYWSRLPKLRSLFGDGGALAVARAAEGALDAVGGFGEEVWFRQGGYLKVSTSPAQDGALEDLVAAARELGVEEEAVALSADEVAERCRSPRFRRGVFVRQCATVQPARLVRALRREALARGVELHEQTRVESIEAGVLTCERGSVHAEQIVVATSAWAADWGPLRRRLTNFGSYVVLTEPVPHLLERINWTGGEAIVDGRRFLHYFRTTADGRVLMGSGGGPIGIGGRIDARFTADAASAARAEAGLRALLPDLAEARVAHAWGGPIDVSVDNLPIFGTVPGARIHYGAGYSGSGVGPSWLGGRILASLALGAEDEWTGLPLVGRKLPALPPEPVRYLGGALVRRALLAVEEAEERGRRPPPVARALVGLPRLLGLRLAERS